MRIWLFVRGEGSELEIRPKTKTAVWFWSSSLSRCVVTSSHTKEVPLHCWLGANQKYDSFPLIINFSNVKNV